MAYDEVLAERIRALLADHSAVREIKMFGGLAFMVDEHMACGVMGSRLMLRLGEDGAEQALREPHVGEMDFTGRPMASMVIVEPDGLDQPNLIRWVAAARAHAASLPPKTPRAAGSAPSRPRRRA